jgi:hypothetical protein
MKHLCLILLLISSFSYGQQLKIIGKPVSAAFDFAGIVAQTMQLNAPDSAHTKSNKQRMQIILKAPDNEAKWVIVDFNKENDNIESVSITGSISDIVELYATLYDKSVKKVKPESVYTGIEKEGEIRRIRTDFQSAYDGEEGTFGRINIIKSNKTK